VSSQWGVPQKADPDWGKIIGQTLKSGEVEWDIHFNESITACIVHFDTDYLSFYGTGTDANKFYINKPLPLSERPSRIQKIE
jgi:hypothetical protein